MTTQPEVLYKVLNADGTCYHGGTGKWHLPGKNRPGKWMPEVKDVKPCARGYHVLKADQLIGWIAPVALFTVEVRGQVVWQSDKGVAEQARLLRRLPAWTEQAACLFACDCAERLRDTVPEDELAEFDACLLTIRRYAFKLATEEELDWAGARARAWAWAGARARAWAWAGARARARAWAWAWAGAGAGARAWAWAGAGAGARAWAWATEEQRAWETARLLQYVHGEVDLEEIRAKVETQ